MITGVMKDCLIVSISLLTFCLLGPCADTSDGRRKMPNTRQTVIFFISLSSPFSEINDFKNLVAA